MTADNRVANLTIVATPAARAIDTQTGFADMGRITLENLSVTGQVSIITRTGTDKLTLIADKVHIAACDSRRYSEQPQKVRGQCVSGRVDRVQLQRRHGIEHSRVADRYFRGYKRMLR